VIIKIFYCYLFLAILLGGCSSGKLVKTSPISSSNSSEHRSFYEVFGQRYYPLRSAIGFTQKGLASWYGPKFHGNKTSNGETFDMYEMTAAHKTLPLPSKVRVTSLANGKQIVVRVNDRGPFVKGRIIDLSFAAARALEFDRKGTEMVSVEVLISPDDKSDNRALLLYPGKIVYQLGAFRIKKNAAKFRESCMLKLNGDLTLDIVENNDGFYRVWLVLSGKEKFLNNPDKFFETKKISEYKRVY
tara:strand:- start:203 stop:934 length:732 start_codon:yes stop_codon:yes gene_type:complete